MKHKPKAALLKNDAQLTGLVLQLTVAEQRDELKRLEDLINTKKDADYTQFLLSELPTKLP
jgi:hypothetical protein